MVTENDSRGNPRGGAAPGHGPQPCEDCGRFHTFQPVPDELKPERRRFQIDDVVSVPVLEADPVDYGTVVDFIDDSERPFVGRPVGTGPLYAVNVGNVFADRYLEAFAESELDHYSVPEPPTGSEPLVEREYVCEHARAVATLPCCGAVRQLLRAHGIDGETFLAAVSHADDECPGAPDHVDCGCPF